MGEAYEEAWRVCVKFLEKQAQNKDKDAKDAETIKKGKRVIRVDEKPLDRVKAYKEFVLAFPGDLGYVLKGQGCSKPMSGGSLKKAKRDKGLQKLAGNDNNPRFKVADIIPEAWLGVWSDMHPTQMELTFITALVPKLQGRVEFHAKDSHQLHKVYVYVNEVEYSVTCSNVEYRDADVVSIFFKGDGSEKNIRAFFYSREQDRRSLILLALVEDLECHQVLAALENHTRIKNTYEKVREDREPRRRKLDEANAMRIATAPAFEIYGV